VVKKNKPKTHTQKKHQEITQAKALSHLKAWKSGLFSCFQALLTILKV